MSDQQPQFGGAPEDSRDPRARWSSMEATGPGRITGRLIFGVVAIVLGILWTLDNLDIVESEPILRWWPIVLVLFGVARLTGFGARRQVVAGAVFTIVGLALLGNELDMLHVRLGQLWPLIIIVLGASLVMRSVRGPAPSRDPSDRFNQVSTFAMWSGSTLKNESPDFRGGDLNAVMGGVDLDLRGARTASPQVVLDLFAWWGGIDIRVPADWRVVSEVTAFMGGFEDKTIPVSGPPTTVLVLRGVVIMGGIEVKN